MVVVMVSPIYSLHAIGHYSADTTIFFCTCLSPYLLICESKVSNIYMPSILTTVGDNVNLECLLQTGFKGRSEMYLIMHFQYLYLGSISSRVRKMQITSHAKQHIFTGTEPFQC